MNTQNDILAAGDFSTQTFIAPSGAELCVRHMKASPPVKGIIHINHGAAEHSERYLEFAQTMSAQGFHVFAHDHRGHGATSVPGIPSHVFGEDGWNLVIEDALALGAHIKGAIPKLENDHGGQELPFILAGHSMGAVVAFEMLLRDPVCADGLLLSGPVLQKNSAMPVLQSLLKMEAAFKEPESISTLFQKLAWDPLNKPYKPARTAYDWLSRDEDEVDKYLADPECGWPPTVNFAVELSKGLAKTYKDARLKSLRSDMPVLMMSGSHDSSTANGASVAELEKRLTEAGAKRISSKIFPEMRHELFNERDREQVYDYVSEWCHSFCQGTVTSN